MNTTANRFHVIAGTEVEAGALDFADLASAKSAYLELFHQMSTAPKLMDVFGLTLLDGAEVLMESTPKSRAVLRHEANIEAGLAVLAAQS